MKTCNANYKKDMAVLKPITIKGMEIRNRMVMPGMGTLFGNPDSTVSKRLKGYIEARAKGGMGLIIVEYTAVSPEGKASALELGIWDDRFIPGLTELVDVAHKHGAKIGIQLHHAGRGTSSKLTGLPIVGASPLEGTKGEIPKEMTKEEILDLEDKYAQAALRAKKAGFDCVEIHGAHGYLIHQFMSPVSNIREDEYGGTLENRMRFPVEIVKKVRKAVGTDYPICFRLSAEDVMENGRCIDDCVTESKMLESAGVDILNVSDGMLESAYMIITGGKIAPGFLADNAAKIKAEVNIPVIVVGKIHTPEIAEDIITSGKADLVALGRACLVDPEFPNKLKDGRWEDILQCVHCLNGCYDEPVTCLQNPCVGHEYEYGFDATPLAKKVLVIGGGPGGLEAAVTAAKRCHKVVLLEKEEKTGGQARLASYIPGKDDFMNIVEVRRREAEANYVTIVTGEEGTVESVKKYNADSVILATGAKPIVPNVPGADGENVVTAIDVLKGEKTGEKVIVIGGGSVGAETAAYLAQKGKKVTIVEMAEKIASDIPFGNKIWLLKELEEAGVFVMTNSMLIEVTKTGAIVKSSEGQTAIEADTIVMAIGSRPENSLEAEIKKVYPNMEVYTIGDAKKVRRVQQAVTEGNCVGRMI